MESIERLEQMGPSVRRVSKSEYEMLALAGCFANERVELIDGQIIQMPPCDELHARSASRTIRALILALPEEFLVRPRNPIDARENGLPEPDIAVVLTSHLKRGEVPSQAELVIEVSDSTLKYDQSDKASLYASLGIRDYWIINLVERTLEVRRQPIARAAARFGFDYASILILTRGQNASPLVAPDVVLMVNDLLP